MDGGGGGAEKRRLHETNASDVYIHLKQFMISFSVSLLDKKLYAIHIFLKNGRFH